MSQQSERQAARRSALDAQAVIREERARLEAGCPGRPPPGSRTGRPGNPGPADTRQAALALFMMPLAIDLTAWALIGTARRQLGLSTCKCTQRLRGWP